MIVKHKVKKIECKQCKKITKHDWHYLPRIGYSWVCCICDKVIKDN